MINIILYEPEIPMNVGNIIRSCAAFGCTLHLIRPYGFFLDDKRIRRSATNHDQIDLHEYDDWQDFCAKNTVNNSNLFLYTKRGKKAPDAYDYTGIHDIYLLFGRESTGVPREIMELFPNWVRIPMDAKMISINLSNSVAIAIYEILRQTNFPNLLQDGHWTWDA